TASGGITGQIAATLQDPENGNSTRMSVAQLAHNLLFHTQDVAALTITGSASATLGNVQIGNNLLGALGIASPEISVSIPDILHPQPVVTTNIDKLLSVKDLSIGQVLNMISGGISYLQSLQGLSILDQKFTLVNKSVNDLM